MNQCVHAFFETRGEQIWGAVRVVCVYCGQVRAADTSGRIFIELEAGEVYRKEYEAQVVSGSGGMTA